MPVVPPQLICKLNFHPNSSLSAKEHHGDGNSYVVNLWGMLLGKQRDVMGNREVALRARAPRSLARLRVRRSRDYLVSHA